MEDAAYLQSQIITYIGNKRALLPFIGEGLGIVKRRLGKNKLRSLDLFSGTGIVARYLKQHSAHIIANDLENYSRITNECYLSNASAVDPGALQSLAAELRRAVENNLAPGFITELYAPRDEDSITPQDRCFYTRRNAQFLDTARQQIAALPADMQKYFLAPLIARASVHANTSGVFKGFYKNKNRVGEFGGHAKNALSRILGKIEIDTPVFSRFECDFSVMQGDANTIIDDIAEVDIAYLDPPYNQHPYGSNYFMLNLLADYERPAKISKISGIPTNWKRSAYNLKTEAENALLNLVARCKAKFILISYNSEGFISREGFINALEKCGKLTVLETKYNTFRASRNLGNRSKHVREFLYLLEKQ
ncbi:DNA modification methylase [Ereboglobus luteus]|uniref:site-specific DNA-methyltransferase (adenine-specific) n=1 Tax=Ereboglobus luteus TaxID=1796921 RepID=A0A2U8E0X1_9BACT|nr:DNA modification methylase [Ereboglobus luteus]